MGCLCPRLAPGGLSLGAASAGLGRFVLRDDAAHLVVAGGEERLLVEGRRAGEQFVEQDAEAVDVGAGVDVEVAHRGLLRAHVDRGAEELLEAGEEGLLGEFVLGGLGDAEVDHLGHRPVGLEGDHHVGGLEVAVDDAFLVGVVDGGADVLEKGEALLGVEFLLAAEVGDRDTLDQFHDEVGPTGGGGPGVEDPGDVGVVHHGERLALGLEAREHLAGVHAGLDHLEGDHAGDGAALLGHPDRAEAALADLLAQGVGADLVALGLGIGSVGEVTGSDGDCLGVAEKGIDLPSFDQQALDLEPQLRVVAAGLG